MFLKSVFPKLPNFCALHFYGWKWNGWQFISFLTQFLSQIKEKLLQLTDKRKEMIDKWEDRWEWLRLGKTLTFCRPHPLTSSKLNVYLCVCVCSNSPGGASVLKGCRCGRVMVAGSGTVPVQQRDRSECRWGGEAHQTPWSFWKICCHLGGTLLCTGAADHGLILSLS